MAAEENNQEKLISDEIKAQESQEHADLPPTGGECNRLIFICFT